MTKKNIRIYQVIEKIWYSNSKKTYNDKKTLINQYNIQLNPSKFTKTNRKRKAQLYPKYENIPRVFRPKLTKADTRRCVRVCFILKLYLQPCFRFIKIWICTRARVVCRMTYCVYRGHEAVLYGSVAGTFRKLP